MTDIHIRDIAEADIPLIMDYWFNPENQSYHEKRMHFGEEQKGVLRGQPEILKSQIAAPLALRKSTTAIVEYGGRAIGHVLLNEIQDDEARRMHFHMWPHKIERKKLGEAITFLPNVVYAALNYFFLCFEFEHITGDISVKNKPANYMINRMGFKAIETVEATYLGQTGIYNRYRFYK